MPKDELDDEVDPLAEDADVVDAADEDDEDEDEDEEEEEEEEEQDLEDESDIEASRLSAPGSGLPAYPECGAAELA